MARLHHVNLGIPVGGTDAEAGFLVDVLGHLPGGHRLEVNQCLERALRQLQAVRGIGYGAEHIQARGA